jgi:hypothetical protein
VASAQLLLYGQNFANQEDIGPAMFEHALRKASVNALTSLFLFLVWQSDRHAFRLGWAKCAT